MSTLPPLNALKAFEVIAQSGGVRAASEILHVSQSSISRHLSILEDHLQLKLFHRVGRGLILSDAGKDYLLQIGPALETIGSATVAIKRKTQRSTVTLSAPPTLTANWLLPRLPEFLADNPDIDLRLVNAMTLNLTDHDIDCAIEYRFQPAHALSSVLLLKDEIVPVISPDHFNATAIHSLNDLKGITLIETERRLLSWQSVLQGVGWFEKQSFLTVNYSVHALEAARLGLGVALANRHNASGLIASGALVVPFNFPPEKTPRAPRYYVSVFKQTEEKETVSRLRNWLLLQRNI